MENKNPTGKQYDPFEGYSTDELARMSRVYDPVTNRFGYVCPYCDRLFAVADDLYAHLEGDGGED